MYDVCMEKYLDWQHESKLKRPAVSYLNWGVNLCFRLGYNKRGQLIANGLSKGLIGSG